jgi:hypothetical protein
MDYTQILAYTKQHEQKKFSRLCSKWYVNILLDVLKKQLSTSQLFCHLHDICKETIVTSGLNILTARHITYPFLDLPLTEIKILRLLDDNIFMVTNNTNTCYQGLIPWEVRRFEH